MRTLNNVHNFSFGLQATCKIDATPISPGGKWFYTCLGTIPMPLGVTVYTSTITSLYDRIIEKLEKKINGRSNR